MLQRRAYYNFLSMNPQEMGASSPSWQITNWRNESTEALFQSLYLHSIESDKTSFQQLCENFDTPEELAQMILSQEGIDEPIKDLIYLTVFELWRRLVPHKPSLSILGEEIDFQINAYDTGICHAESLQDLIILLQSLIEESEDEKEGMGRTFFQIMKSYCATDLENFIYDYTATQIDEGEIDYALDLLCGLAPYVTDQCHFVFLRARIDTLLDPTIEEKTLSPFIEEVLKSGDVDLGLELLLHLANSGSSQFFISTAKLFLNLIQNGEDLCDYLSICQSFYARLDKDKQVQEIEGLLHYSSQGTLSSLDPTKIKLIELLQEV